MDTPSEHSGDSTHENLVIIKVERADDEDPLSSGDGAGDGAENQNGVSSLNGDGELDTFPLAKVKEEHIEIEVTYPLDVYTSNANADYETTPTAENKTLNQEEDTTHTNHDASRPVNVGAISLISDAKVKEFCKRRNRVRRPVAKNQKVFECDLCGKSFIRNAHLIIHKRFHDGTKPFKCDECGIHTATISILNEHRRIHTGEKPYTCDECDVSFSKISNLKRHKRIHAGEKPFLCDLCNTPFSRKSHLEKHKMTHRVWSDTAQCAPPVPRSKT